MITYCLQTTNSLHKALNSHISRNVWPEAFPMYLMITSSFPRKMDLQLLHLNWRILFWKRWCNMILQNFLFLPNERDSVSYLVRLLPTLMVMRCRQSTVVYRDNCLLKLFHYLTSQVFHDKSAPFLLNRWSVMIMRAILTFRILKSTYGSQVILYFSRRTFIWLLWILLLYCLHLLTLLW